MAATVSAMCSPKVKFREYIENLLDDFQQSTPNKGEIYKRLAGLLHNYNKQRKMLELAVTISQENNIPFEYKYWF